MTDRRASPLVTIALLGVQTCWGIYPVIGKIALRTIPPLAFAAIRVAGASLLLFAIGRARIGERIESADWPRVIVLALLGTSINQVLFIEGLARSTAVNASLLMTMIPVITLALAIGGARERADARKVFGCLLAVAGAMALLGAARFDLRSSLFVGDLLLLGNATAYSIYLVLSRDLLRKYSALTYTTATFAVGSVPVVLLASPDLLRLRYSAVPAVAWICMVAVIVFPSALAYLWNSWALARVEASRVAIFTAVQPLVAVLFGWLWLTERLAAGSVLAGVLILTGLAVSRPPRLKGPSAAVFD